MAHKFTGYGQEPAGNSMQILLIILSGMVLLLSTEVVDAFDFYGAVIIDKEAPSAAWSSGVNGIHPTVNRVSNNSPAGKAGLKLGDIILSVNDTDIKKTSDLAKFADINLSIYIFSGFKFKTISIDEPVINADNSTPKSDNKKISAVDVSRNNIGGESSDDSAPLKFNDVELENKYGTSSPAELERTRRLSEINRRKEIEKDQDGKVKKSTQGISLGDHYYLVNNRLIKPAYTRTETYPVNVPDRYGGHTEWRTREIYEIEERRVTIENDGEVWSFRILCHGLRDKVFEKMSVGASRALINLVCE
jgi:hypothetical protein